MSKIALAALAFVFLAVASIPMSAQLIPHGNVYAGVSYGQLSVAVNQQSYRGFEGTGEFFPFARFTHLSVLIDGSGYFRNNRYSSVHQYDGMGGVRWSNDYGKFRIFVHGMGGYQTVNSAGITYNHAVEDAGGGLDYKLPFKNFSWRIQGDYMHTSYASATQNDYRASTGIVWRF